MLRVTCVFLFGPVRGTVLPCITQSRTSQSRAVGNVYLSRAPPGVAALSSVGVCVATTEGVERRVTLTEFPAAPAPGAASPAAPFFLGAASIVRGTIVVYAAFDLLVTTADVAAGRHWAAFVAADTPIPSTRGHPCCRAGWSIRSGVAVTDPEITSISPESPTPQRGDDSCPFGIPVQSLDSNCRPVLSPSTAGRRRRPAVLESTDGWCQVVGRATAHAL